MSKHALLSPSSSNIWLNCPASAHYQERFPSESTVYAEEGTEAHALAEYKLKKALGRPASDPREKGMKYLTEEMEECTDDYVSYILETIGHIKETCPDPQVLIEQEVDLSKYAKDSFGRADCIIVADGSMYVIDLKYGQGYEVNAFWNSQFLMYALGSLDLLDAYYDVTDVTVVAFQPRKDNISTFTITAQELRTWGAEVLFPKAEKAYAENDEFKAGEHCHFCKGRFTCKARALYNLELAKYEFKEPVSLTVEEISDILSRSKEFTAWLGDINDYALKELALKGIPIPGWKLVESRSIRKYKEGSEDQIAQIVTSLGKDPWDKTLKTITAMEKLIGKKEFSQSLSSFVYKPSGHPTLAPLSDKRPSYSSAQEDFAVCEAEEINN